LSGLGNELVKPGRLVIPTGLTSGLLGGACAIVRLRRGFGLTLGLALGWPRRAVGDGGLVLTLEGPVYGGEVGFELAPPPHHGLWLTVGFSLLLFRSLLREPAALQLGPGLSGCFPSGAGAGGPFLITGVRGFHVLALGRHVAGKGFRIGRSGRVVLDIGVGGLMPGVSLGLRSKTQFPRHVGRGAGKSAFPVEDPGLQLALGHEADGLRLVAYFQGPDRGLAQVFEFGIAAVRFGCDGLAGVGDPGGFAVGGGGRGPPGVFLA